MSEEKKLILKMLKENKISEDEALKLLDAIGNNENIENEEDKDTEKNFEFSTSNFVSKIINGVEKALNIASKKIENMDFDFVNFSSQNFNSKTIKNYTYDIDNDINLFIKNKNGSVEIINSYSDNLEIKANISYDSNNLDENYEFIESKIENNDYYFGIKDETSQPNYVVNFQVYVPEDYTKSINVISSNAGIKISEVDTKNINLKTSNAKIDLQEVNSDEIIATTSNANISLEEIESKTINITTSNARINICECSADKLVATTSNARITLDDISIADLITKTSNGSIQINDLDCATVDAKSSNASISISDFADNIKNIRAKTSNGSIRIEDINLERSVKAVTSGKDSSGFSSLFKNINKNDNEIVATTESYNYSDENTLNIEAYTSNARVTIE
ncbi:MULTISPECIES: DUF4097 family beta strand repeat-containing protein [Helcococcus]|uniref:DUF4097 family beta strand repeat-containing protein n=1 Tax=Helcococcus bovis TaxID=3153252 RepID=A0ABW9F8B1_9FIRM